MSIGRKRRGFTLIELLAVIIVISLIAAILVPRIGSRIGKSKAGIAKSKMSIVSSAIENFYIDCGRYPETLDELLVAPEDLEGKWTARYLKPSELEDPWGNPYDYNPEGEINEGGYDLISYGADGQPDGEGEKADIYND